VGFVTHGNDSRVRRRDLTVLKLLSADIVDDVFFDVSCPRAFAVERADDVGLVVLPGQVSGVHVDDIVCIVDPEHGVCRVPINVVHPLCGQDGAWQTNA